MAVLLDNATRKGRKIHQSHQEGNEILPSMFNQHMDIRRR